MASGVDYLVIIGGSPDRGHTAYYRDAGSQFPCGRQDPSDSWTLITSWLGSPEYAHPPFEEAHNDRD